ncbi:MAG: CBS domain-containing protein [Halobacteria archaeon]
MRSLKIGTVMGIPIKLHITLVLFIPLIVYIIAGDITSEVGAKSLQVLVNEISPHQISVSSLQSGLTPFLLGLGAAFGLFFSVAVHELGHSWVALRHELEISSITLWIFGGMAQMEDTPRDWWFEFKMAIAGPITSVLVGLGFFILLQVLPPISPELLFLFSWLTVMNIVLAVFNMLPAFPMDGGRVLRALLSRNRNYVKATQTAANIGKLFAVLMGLFGLLSLNPLMILIAMFVYVAATGEAKATVISESLEGITAGDLMTREVKVVHPEMAVAELMDRMMREHHTGYPVTENGDLIGVVTLSDVKKVKPVERDAYRVREIMSDDVITVEPDEPSMEALKKIGKNNIGRLIVTREGEMMGILSRTDITRALNILQNKNAPGTSDVMTQSRTKR